MRSHFSEYYRPSDADFRKLWSECFFSFDANVLLNQYRLKPETRERLFGILDKVKDRIWLSNQAAKEYFLRRLGVIQEQIDKYSSFSEKLGKSHDELDALFSKHASSDKVQEVMAGLREAYLTAQDEIAAIEASQPNLLEDDGILARFTALFDRVGDPMPREQFAKLRKEFDERLENRIPPGFRDKKGGEWRYGDVLIWYQLLDEAKKRKQPIVFVTDDLKEDWWLLHKDANRGPRPELIAEAREVAGVSFYMYSSERFIEFAASHLGTKNKADKQAIADIVETRKREEQKRGIEASHVSVMLNRANEEQDRLVGLMREREHILRRRQELGDMKLALGLLPPEIEELRGLDEKLIQLTKRIEGSEQIFRELLEITRRIQGELPPGKQSI